MTGNNVYKITQVLNYDEIELEVAVGVYEEIDEGINKIASKSTRAILKKEGLHILYGTKYFIVSDGEKEKYKIKKCTKVLPKPINAKNLNQEGITALLNDERYMTTPDDYKTVYWNLSKLYEELRKLNPEKEIFSFSSIAYGYEILSG